MDSLNFYNKKEIEIALKDIFTQNKYNFTLKDNTIKNIINKCQHNSIKFTKYSALEHYKKY